MSYKALKPIIDSNLKYVARLSAHSAIANYDGVYEKITVDIITESVDAIAQKYADVLFDMCTEYIDLEIAKAKEA